MLNAKEPRLFGTIFLMESVFAATLLFAPLTLGQEPRPTAIPPGVMQAGQAETKAERDIPPPTQGAKRTLDLGKLQQDANQLSTLAQTIPSDVADIRKGMLPKDLSLKLKQIEKLSKHLRSELNQ